MHYKAMFKGEFISAAEFGDKQPTVTVTGVKLCKLEQEDGRQKDKGIVMLKETDRGWVMNKTNAQCIAAMFGDETDQWIGKRLTLYATNVRVGAKTEPGIRVKGSPDIAAPVDVVIKLPRKKPVTMRMEVTGRAAATVPVPVPVTAPVDDVFKEAV